MPARRDRGLAVRMLATLVVVLVANVLFVGFLVSLAAPWIEPAIRDAGRAAGLSRSVRSLWWAPVVFGTLAVALWLQLRYVRRETLAAVDARRVTATDRPGLHDRVTRLASQAATPVPALYVVDSAVPNSFALDGLGRPAIVVSEGLLSTLDDEALDAVLAHELAHVENRDATVMTLASFLPALTSDRYSALSSLGPWARSSAFWTVGVAVLYGFGAAATGANAFDPAYAVRFAGALVATVVVGGVALGVFATVTAVAARRLSRYREFAADRAGVTLAGNPAALADALVRLDGGTGTPRRDKRLAYGSVHGLCLLPHGFNPRAEVTDEGMERDDANPGDEAAFHVETRTHPPTDERVARLRDLVDE